MADYGLINDKGVNLNKCRQRTFSWTPTSPKAKVGTKEKTRARSTLFLFLLITIELVQLVTKKSEPNLRQIKSIKI